MAGRRQRDDGTPMTLPHAASRRLVVNIVLDGVAGLLAVWLATWLATPAAAPPGAFSLLTGALCVIAGGAPFGLATQYWRYTGLHDFASVGAASLLSAGLYAALHLASGLPLPSSRFPFLHAMSLFLVMGTARALYRLWRTRGEGGEAAESVPVLLVGDTAQADLFLRALSGGRGLPYHAIGILSLSPRERGRRLHNCPILGTVAEAEAILTGLAQRGGLPRFLVLTADLAGEEVRALLELADRFGLAVRRAPHPTLLAAPKPAAPLNLRPIAIEDLLNRREAPLDRAGMGRLIAGRRVAITGAGGSIGSELARQVAQFAPAELLLIEHSEYALWQIDVELAESFPALPRSAVIADVRDARRIGEVFARHRPELVFHAAALKHVPLVEIHPLEGLLTNTVGTRVVADAARAVGARAMVLISTDKAVNPTSVMGASKRLAEMYAQALDLARAAAGARGLRCITVRFGNVLGSTGSVVPLFQRQLAQGGPLTVTHPDITRYFMTIREAVGLVLQATVVGLADEGGEVAPPGGIFVLDMGEPVRIVDLARQMIRLAGLRPDIDVAIRFTGLRPGEKLFEELFHGDEPPAPTRYPGLLMAAPRTVELSLLNRALDELAALCQSGQTGAALDLLARFVPEYRTTPASRLGRET